MNDPFVSARLSATAIAEVTGVGFHDVAVVLGSGWSSAAARLGDTIAECHTTELPGFAEPAVDGHSGLLRSVRNGKSNVLVLSGRVHGYEGHPPQVVVHAVRSAVLAGCGVVVLTNASGAIREDLAVGQPVLISDHLDFTGSSPLTGPNPDGLGPRFPDLSDCWSARLRSMATDLDPDLQEGVYVAVDGPQYETPAEIRMFGRLGGDLVGMSTVHEAIAAVHLGAEVLGVSLVTNLAAGLGGPLDHADVVAAGLSAAERVGSTLAALIERL